MTAPNVSQLAPAMLPRGRAASWRATAASTGPARAASSVMRMACAAVSCSACASRSAASHSGSLCLSAITSTSDGPGDGIDADDAEHLPLGRGHVGVAGADDLGHRRGSLSVP